MTKKFLSILFLLSACGGGGEPSGSAPDDDDDDSPAGPDARASDQPSDASRDAARGDAGGAPSRDASRDAQGSGAPPAKAECPTETRAPSELHRAALDVLTPATPCALASCHGTRGKVAGLVLAGATDLRSLLVDKDSCEAPKLKLVDGSGGEAALANSWLWLKLTSEVGADGVIDTSMSARYGEADSCGQSPDEPYGVLMPLGSEPLEEEQLAPIRDWICAGAPGS